MGFYREKLEVHLTGIEPVTFGFVGRNSLESKALETKHDEHFTKSEGVQEVAQNFPDERFAELARAWATLPKSTKLGILALADIAKANSQDRGLSGIIGTMTQNPRAESPCPARAEKKP